MKIAHLSDTHLGRFGLDLGMQQLVPYPKPGGPLKRRSEAAIMEGLENAIDRIIEVVRPDLVIHTGNLFDVSQPMASTLDFAITQLKRLNIADIPLVIIEGNHSCPSKPEQGHTLALLSHFPGITVACEYECAIPVPDVNVRIHALPHRAILHGRLPDLADLNSAAVNILVAHCVADGLPFYKTGRSAAQMAIREYAPHFNYVALGHNRYFAQVPGTDRAFYAGTTALVTLGDFRPGYRFGFNVITIDEGAPLTQPPTVEREELDTVPMHTYGLDNAQSYSARDILDFLTKQAEAVSPEDAYCRVVVEGMNTLARSELSERAVGEIFRTAASCRVILRRQEQKFDVAELTSIEGSALIVRFKDIVGQIEADDEFRAQVLTIGEEMLLEAGELVNAADVEASHHETLDGDN